MIVFALAMLGVFLLSMGLGRTVGGDQKDPGSKDTAPSYSLTVLGDPQAGKQQLSFLLEAGEEPLGTGDLDVVHEKRLHLIAVREDLSGFQHVHPEEVGEGDQDWQAPLELTPGTWRLYGDFTESGKDPAVATATLEIPGEEPSADGRGAEVRQVEVDGYTVALKGDLVSGGASMLTPQVTRGGKAVELEPYLGALGHLVVIKHGTFEYLHVHPDGQEFHTEVEETGTYELYLQFKHDGKVHTAQFTQMAGATASDQPTGTGHEGHDD